MKLYVFMEIIGISLKLRGNKIFKLVIQERLLKIVGWLKLEFEFCGWWIWKYPLAVRVWLYCWTSLIVWILTFNKWTNLYLIWFEEILWEIGNVELWHWKNGFCADCSHVQHSFTSWRFCHRSIYFDKSWLMRGRDWMCHDFRNFYSWKHGSSVFVLFWL